MTEFFTVDDAARRRLEWLRQSINQETDWRVCFCITRFSHCPSLCVQDLIHQTTCLLIALTAMDIKGEADIEDVDWCNRQMLNAKSMSLTQESIRF